MPTAQPSEFLLDVEYVQPRSMPRFEFDEHVHIAIRTEIVAQHGAKQAKMANAAYKIEIVVTAAQL